MSNPLAPINIGIITLGRPIKITVQVATAGVQGPPPDYKKVMALAIALGG